MPCRDPGQTQRLALFRVEDPLEKLWAHRSSLWTGQHVLHSILEDSAVLAILTHFSFKQSEKDQRFVGVDDLIKCPRCRWVKHELDVGVLLRVNQLGVVGKQAARACLAFCVFTSLCS